MIIKFFSSFCDSSVCKSKYERLCETHKLENYGPGKELYITTGEDYTHAIILNTAMPPLKIPKENVLGLAFEPPAYLGLTVQFINYAQKHIGKYFMGDRIFWLDTKKTLPDLFIEHYAYIWHNAPLSHIPVKKKLMSIVVSNKLFSPGHKYRHALVQQILQAGFPIDIYGNGSVLAAATAAAGNSNSNSNRNGNWNGTVTTSKMCNLKKTVDTRIKGIFKDFEPYENYLFHISIENFQTNAYFSEKINNALLCGTTPIYWGCKKILQMFPANVIMLSGNIEQDMTLLRNILLNPKKYTAKINVDSIKNKLNLLTTNLFKQPFKKG